MGYSKQLEGHRLASKYIKFIYENKQVTIGNFYDQFGSGLAFRTYENRELGINTSIDGVNYIMSPFDFLTFKIIGGKQLGFKKKGSSIILGGNFVFSFSDLLFPDKNISLASEFGWVGKYEEVLEDEWIDKDLNNVMSYTAGVNLSIGDFSLSTEYVSKSNDPSQLNGLENEKGFAWLFNPSFSKKGIGANAIIRRLSRMDFRSEKVLTDGFFMLNYIPANTKQHKYSLANLHPYSAQSINEFGWQADLFYLISKKTNLGGKYGTRVAVNYSKQFANSFAVNNSFKLLYKSENMVYRDFNLEVDKKWNQQWKTILSYINLNMENYFLVPDYEAQKLNIVVADVQYKIKPTKSLRIELQHLWAETQSKNWYALHSEYSVAPGWSVFISDMVNYSGNTIHYPNGGIQLNIKSTSLQLNYGRNREGYKCSGGICRWVPAYTGFGFSLTTNF